MSFLGKGEGLESKRDEKNNDEEERKKDDLPVVDRNTLLSAPAAVMSAPTASSHASPPPPVVPTDVVRPPSLPVARRGLLGRRDEQPSVGMHTASAGTDGGETQTIHAPAASATVPSDTHGHAVAGATIEAVPTAMP